jgi:hypothetical protein
MGTIGRMLPSPAQRTPLHNRTLTFRGYARADGLWDMEGELLDLKHYDHLHGNGTRAAGEPVHHILVRVTVDAQLRIQDIQTSMNRTPFGECGVADQHVRRMVGQTMGRGWRKAIDTAMGGLHGCTHLRELLFNLATAAFQTIPHDLEMKRMARGEPMHTSDQPPFYMGKCMTWDFNGPVVARLTPQFAGWIKPVATDPAG